MANRKESSGQLSSDLIVKLGKLGLKRENPYRNITLDQVLHVPFDRVQMFLDVVEVLNGLICSHAACVTLVLD